MASTWTSADTPDTGTSNMRAAIAFALFCILTMAGSTWFAWQRFQQGNAQEFAPSYDADTSGGLPAGAPYTYPGGDISGGGETFNEPPFSGGQRKAYTERIFLMLGFHSCPACVSAAAHLLNGWRNGMEKRISVEDERRSREYNTGGEAHALHHTTAMKSEVKIA